MRVSVRNLQRKVRVNIAALRRSAEKSLRLVLAIQRSRSSLTELPEIAVLLISDRRMTALHRQFLHHDGPTDVITFEHGEIFISADTAQRNAREFGNSLRSELQLYVVHGLLHLHGFDDRSAGDARKMKRAQDKIVAALN